MLVTMLTMVANLRKLGPAEKNYSAVHSEVLAIVANLSPLSIRKIPFVLDKSCTQSYGVSKVRLIFFSDNTGSVLYSLHVMNPKKRVQVVYRGCLQPLKGLEAGAVMFSADEDVDVLVSAPIAWIEGDNPCHSILCGILGSTTPYLCRKCYICLSTARADFLNTTSATFTTTCLPRSRVDYCNAEETPNRSTPILTTRDGKDVIASKLSYADKKSGSLLDLKAFDPSKDTPVEVLHTVLLGLAKYLINHLINDVLKKNTSRLSRLQDLISQHQQNPAFNMSRKSNRQLRHCGSFLGRDYKFLLQVLPLALTDECCRDNNLFDIKPLFVKLGKL